MTAPVGYETKFAEFIRALEENKLARRRGKKGADVMLVAMPQALGDTYEELVESLNRLADARLQLEIVPRAERKKPSAAVKND